jgi:hypothetical protein
VVEAAPPAVGPTAVAVPTDIWRKMGPLPNRKENRDLVHAGARLRHPRSKPLWVYYSAQIFLLGAEFTKVYAKTHGSKQGALVAEDAPLRST